jgi:hypothetical protein
MEIAMRGFFLGGSKRNQPVELEPVNERKRVCYPAPSGENNAAQDGFQRLAQADARTGIRPSTGGTPVYPPYHEDL